jgi:hypothetical protein
MAHSMEQRQLKKLYPKLFFLEVHFKRTFLMRIHYELSQNSASEQE